MKKAILFLLFFAALASVAVGQNANDWFTTLWDLSKPTKRVINNPATTIAFPGVGSGYTLYWEDADDPTPPGKHGTVPSVSSNGSISPYYLPVPTGTTKVRIKVHKGSGTFSAIHFSSYTDLKRLIAVEQWGTTVWSTMINAFHSCENMDVTATDVPDLSACQILGGMFTNCKSLVNVNSSISDWQTQNITNMSGMFKGATSFNQPIGNWNTAKVTSIASMFSGATSFNKPLNSWNTAKVTNMSYMFSGATSFNQPLNSWNTAKVTDMSDMFSGATSFNRPLNWNTKNAFLMENMFAGATVFDQDIGNWDMRKVSDVRGMFSASGMSCTNYSATLYGWTKNVGSLKPNVQMTLQTNMKYNRRGEYARNKLTAVKNWQFGGDTYDLACGIGLALTADYESEWDLSKPVWPARSDAATTLVTNLIGTNFVVMWENMANPSDNGIESSANGTAASPFKITGLTAGAKYRIIAFSTSATNKLTGLCAEKADYQRLTKVTHWGTTQWTSLTKAFSGCGNMDITATDMPDLSAVTDLSMMFQSCGSLVYNTSINDWDVSHVTNMSGMFATATEFNQPLNNWDVSHVTNMSSMFAEALKFNQPLNNWVVSSVTNMSGTFVAAMKFNQNINSWNVSNVTDMSNMFGNADDFNQPLNNWVTSKVTNMSGMFSMASKFNQDINSWDVSKVTNMSSMFNNAKAFNKPLNNWDVSKVTDMNSMFRYTDLFNQDITGWDVSAVTNMQSMFERALVFNQDIKGWNTRNVTDMQYMFKQAAAFDRNLGSLRIDALTNGTEMFASSGMSCDNYSKTLKGWAESSNTPSNVNFITQTGIAYGRQGKPYRDKLTSQKNWTISGDSLDFACSIGLITPDVYVSEWDLSKPELLSRPDAATTLITNLVGTNFVVEYINLADSTDKGVVNTANGIHLVPFKLTGLSAGAKYRIIAYSNPNIAGSVFSEISYQCDYKRLSKVTQWGTKKWSSLENAFWGCENMDVTATDVPDLSVCQKLNGMFYNCHNLENANGSISRWVIDNITDIGYLFAYTPKFNQPLNNWNTTNVTNMGAVFEGATSFNQPLNNWNTANVTNMSRMFSGATSFNQPIDNWNTGNVIYLLEMFKNATSFNQPLNNWNTIKTTQMNEMFYGATSFDQPLDGLEIKAVLYISDIFKDCGMSCENLSITLQSFQNQAASYLMYSRWIGALSANQYYNQTGQAAITALQARGWTITGGTYAEDCITPKSWFTTVWDITKPTDRTNSPNTTIAFPGVGTNYRIDWEDVDNPTLAGHHGTVTVPLSSATSPYYLAVPSGITKVRIKAHKAGGTFYNFVQTYQNSNKPDSKRLIAVEQWGSNKWTSMYSAFYSCENMDVTATDVPDLSTCQYFNFMFSGCTSLVNTNGSISGWNTAKVTDMSYMFQNATLFNQPLDSFKIDAVTTNMENMLQGSGISCENLSTTLDSWKRQAAAQNKNNINLGDISTVPNMYNEMGRDAIAALTARGWTISGGRFAPGCVSPDSYVSEWDMSKPATTGTATDLVTNLWGSSFRVEWKNLDDGTTGSIASATATTAPLTITGLTAGKRYRVVAYPNSTSGSILKKLATEDGGGVTMTDVARLDSVTQWGANKWMSLEGAFRGCSRMDVTATDKPDLRGVKNLSYMFYHCDSLVYNPTINTWHTDSITNMSNMFYYNLKFNQPLGNWNTANVTDMSSMFCTTNFNQPLNSWNTAKVTNMKSMFSSAYKFNQPLNNWNVEKVTTMEFMLHSTSDFDQNLGSWQLNSISNADYIFFFSGMSCDNYSATLEGWGNNPSLPSGVSMNFLMPMKFGRLGKIARDKLVAKGWTFSKDTYDPLCGAGVVLPTDYVSEWDLSQPAQGSRSDAATTLITNLWGTNFVVEWLNLNDSTTGAAIATTTTTPYTITGLTAGKRYRVVAYADPSNPSSTFSKLATMKGGGYTTITDAQRLDSVTQWGTNRWTSLDSAFFLCSRMDVTATDVPDLRGVKDLSYMFGGCDSLVYNPTINTWRTDSITNMEYMFGEDKKFNQPLGSWNTERVTNMHGMFQGTHKFDQDIHNWNTGKVTDMSQMFIRAFKFNQPIGSWNTANVTGMGYMFAFATSFNKPLYWNVEKVTNMTSMFWGADAFDQDLSYWTLKNVTYVGDMFKADLNKGMSCGNYSETLQGWAINPLTKTGLNFGGQDNRQYNMIGKEARDILTKPIANGGKGWTISGDTYDKNCGIDYVWTGAVSTNIADNGNWQGGQHPGSSPILGEFRATVAFDSLAVRDMHIPSLPYTPPGSTPNYIHFYSFGNLINNSNKKVVIEPNGHLHINKWVFGSSTPADVDKIVIKADNTNPNGSLILAGQPCDKPVYATVEMYSKAGREATAMTWTDNIPSSPTKDSLFSVHYRWQYIGIPVEGEYANAFYGSYLRKYDETYNDPNHYYGKWRKLGADETWQPLVPFAGYEVTSRTPKVYVFKGRLLHCPQELTLTRQAAEVSAVPSSFNDPRERRWELGHNVFGNSYTSALMIGQGKLFVDLEGRYPLGQEPIEGTVYVYNTGSIADWAGGGTLGSGPGQYVAVPVFSATALSEQYISSMQGFMLKFKEDTLRINGVGSPVKFRIGLNKEEHYLSNIYPFGGNQRPQRAPQADPSDKIHGYLKVGLTSRRSVSSVHLIEAEGTTDEFDNGWDGMQLNTGRSSSATLFVPSEYGDLQVSTSDNIVGDRFGIVNNGDTTYRLTVIRHRLDNHGELYLYDVATNRYTLLDSDTTVYDFTSEGSGNVDKRFVITDRRNADDPNTAVDEAAEDMSLYGYVDGRHTLVVNNHTAEAGTLTLLDVSGKAVYTSPFGVGFSRHDLSHLPAGVYIARLEASVRRATVKAIMMK